MFNFIAEPLLVPERFYSLFDVLLIAVFIMFILLKVISLRRSWINGQTVWFWVLIFINTLGILEIVYLLTNKENPRPRAKKKARAENTVEIPLEEKKTEEVMADMEGIKFDEPATSVQDIDNHDLAQEEVIENFSEIATENEIPEGLPTETSTQEDNQ